jgi:hypothetical protein
LEIAVIEGHGAQIYATEGDIVKSAIAKSYILESIRTSEGAVVK